MKYFILCSLIIGLGFVSAQASSTSLQPSPTMISEEASALLLNTQFTKLIKSHMKQATQHGIRIKIASLSTVRFSNDDTFVSVTLEKKIAADVGDEWVVYGEIVGKMQLGPQGEISFDGIFFKPAAGAPGGATVGN